MYYPKFLKDDDTIAIAAPSAPIGDKVEHFEKSLAFLRSQKLHYQIGPCVYEHGKRSADAKRRCDELHDLIKDPANQAMVLAAGGDYMYEIHPYLDLNIFKKHPKWVMGMSDPTNLVYRLTTEKDIATLYGFNVDSYPYPGNKATKTSIKYLKGDIVPQHSYKRYRTFLDDINDIKCYHKVKYIGEGQFSGRLIGGCLDVIALLLGTPYDKTAEFLKKYRKDGIVWYFDNFALTAFNYYNVLQQFRYAGYFDNCKGVIVGRMALPSENGDDLMTYREAERLIFKDIPVIAETDIGHTSPTMTFINGAIIHVDAHDQEATFTFELK